MSEETRAVLRKILERSIAAAHEANQRKFHDVWYVMNLLRHRVETTLEQGTYDGHRPKLVATEGSFLLAGFESWLAFERKRERK